MLARIYHVAKRIRHRLPPSLQGLLKRIWVMYKGFTLLAITLVGAIPSHHFRRFMYRYVFGMRLGKGSIIHRQARFFILPELKLANTAILDLMPVWMAGVD